MDLLQIFNITIQFWGAVFCLIAAGGMKLVLDLKETKVKQLVIIVCINIVLLLSDGFAWIFDGSASTAGGVTVRICNLMLYCSNYLMIIFVGRYILDDMGERAKPSDIICSKILCAVSSLGIIMTLVSQKFHFIYGIDSENRYYRGSMFLAAQAIIAISFFIMFWMVVDNKDAFKGSQKAIYMGFLAGAGLSLVMQTLYYGLAIVNIVETVGVICMVVYNMVVRVYEGNRNKILLQRKQLEAEKQAQELERTAQKLRENQTEALVSQIQPHFIFNSLLVIRSLCYEDPEKAIDAINHFSKYLRICLDSLNNEKLITLEKELELSENYLYMEKLRFESAVTFHKDIRTESFRLPALTIQPLLENAVKHGLRKKKMVGTIWLTVKKEGNDNVIIVRDNGVGFDVRVKPDDGRNHVGLRNVSLRLQYLCNGSIDIKSRPEYGTEVTIRIPEEMTRNELSDC